MQTCGRNAYFKVSLRTAHLSSDGCDNGDEDGEDGDGNSPDEDGDGNGDDVV